MRNFAQYPIEYEEVVNTLLSIMKEKSDELDEWGVVGSTIPLEIRYTIDFLYKKEVEFKQYLLKRQTGDYGVWNE